MSEQVGALEHSCRSLDTGCIERDDPVAGLVLAAPDVQELLDEIHVASPKVLHLHRPHRRVGGDDRRAVHVLPFRIRRGCIEESLPFLCGQGASDWMLSFREIVDAVCERTPPAARLEHARKHTDVHVDRAVRDAGLVTRALERRNRRRRDRRERHVTEVPLDEAQPFFFELDRPR
ncbi:MAG: hypothetical protein WCP29_13315 [Acidobacteriota bacterium]